MGNGQHISVVMTVLYVCASALDIAFPYSVNPNAIHRLLRE
jgi:hypothetical protein